MRGKATAPYNFIPLPKTVLPASFFDKKSKLAIKDQYVSYVKTKGDLSGVIELDIETRTPFFIGAGKQERFFSPTGGDPIIPGSTMRGMVKNIMKILTCGAMRPSMRKDIETKEMEGDGDFFDHPLYFRGMAAAAGTGIREAYDDELSPEGEDGKRQYAAKPGYLIKCTDNRYYICPAKHEVKNGGGGKFPFIKWQEKGRAECFTGFMSSKRHHTLHHSPRWDTKYPVDYNVIAAYFDDSTRRGFNLLKDKSIKKNEDAQRFTGQSDVVSVVPCFYVRRNEVVQHFGFGRYYRIPYRKSIGDHVPPELRDKRDSQGERIPDFADALFGRKEDWGSRLFFEDCVPVKGTIKYLASSFSRILSTPNPTSFQLYLDQKGGALKTWNDAAQIRGYKLYWHQKNDDVKWSSDKGLKGATPIRPIKSGAKFRGRIRFDRLSSQELGALLKVFELAACDPSVCFKLGRGKSIGMGSVRIDATLRLCDKSAYTQLFDDGGWHRGETDAQSIKEYTRKFDAYLDETLDETERAQYDISQRSLAVMLDWKNTESNNWANRTRMMRLNDSEKPFVNRFILPTVEQMFPNRVKP